MVSIVVFQEAHSVLFFKALVMTLMWLDVKDIMLTLYPFKKHTQNQDFTKLALDARRHAAGANHKLGLGSQPEASLKLRASTL